MKTQSIDCHHTGAPAQHDIVHACVMKIKGVAMQCNKHNVLANEPIVSGLKKIVFKNI